MMPPASCFRLRAIPEGRGLTPNTGNAIALAVIVMTVWSPALIFSDGRLRCRDDTGFRLIFNAASCRYSTSVSSEIAPLTCISLSYLAILSRLSRSWRTSMNEYQLGGSLSLITALGKTNAFAEIGRAHV